MGAASEYIDVSLMLTYLTHMNKTIEVAKAFEGDPSKTVLPTEFARGLIIEHAPSAQALKLAHLMISKAAGRMAEDVSHEIASADIRQIKGMRKHDKASLVPLFAQLRAMTYHFDDTSKLEVTIGGFLDHAKVQYRYDDHGDLKIKWWFSRMFRELAEESNYWAILDRQTVFSLRSKYSILLFQHLSSLFNLTHTNRKSFTIQELRALLNIEEGKWPKFNILNRDVLKPTVAEINQLSRFEITLQSVKRGRYVEAVEFTWNEVGAESAKAELNRPKVGRKHRRDGSAEHPVISFPESGRISGTWEAIAREHAPRLTGNHVPDLLTLSQAFRKWCATKSIRLDAPSVEKTFTTWCKSYSPG